MAVNTYLSRITLNVNAPIKRQRVADWIKKQKPSIGCLQETHLRTKHTYRLKVRGWEKIFHANWTRQEKQELQYSYQTKETLK